MSMPLMVGMCGRQVYIRVVISWKCRSMESGSPPINRRAAIISRMRVRATGPVAPASPYPAKPGSVSILVRQLPAMPRTCIALTAVIFTLSRSGAARAS